MGQTLSQLKNPWAAQADPTAAYEAQRSDLFTLDFSIPLAALRTIMQRAQEAGSQLAGDLLSAMPVQGELPFFASSVEFPDSRVSVSATKRHEVPISWPGPEEALQQITVTFTQDAPVGELARSKVLAFLRAWRAVTRAGRAGQAAGDLQLDLLRASREGRTLIPDFRHNFFVYLWRGRIPVITAANFATLVSANGEVSPDISIEGVEQAGQWTAVRGWLASIQPGQLKHAASGIQDIRATFLAEAIVDGLPPGSTVVGRASTVS